MHIYQAQTGHEQRSLERLLRNIPIHVYANEWCVVGATSRHILDYNSRWPSQNVVRFYRGSTLLIKILPWFYWFFLWEQRMWWSFKGVNTMWTKLQGVITLVHEYLFSIFSPLDWVKMMTSAPCFQGRHYSYQLINWGRIRLLANTTT